MEESSESGHSGGRWRALPAHKERREGEEEVVRDGEEEEEIREGEGEKDSTVQDGSVNSCSQASLTRNLLPASGQLEPPAALLSPPSLLSGPHLSPPPSEQNSTSKPQPGEGG